MDVLPPASALWTEEILKLLNEIECTDEHDDIVYPSSVPFVLVHLACVAAVWSGVTWQAVAICIALYWLRIFAIGAGYHRYFS
ncbi:MAG: hypothetical protein ACXWVR_03175, partial [Rhodoplanes sp.]